MTDTTLTITDLLARAMTWTPEEIRDYLRIASRMGEHVEWALADAWTKVWTRETHVIDASRSCEGCEFAEYDETGFVACGEAWPCFDGDDNPHQCADDMLESFDGDLGHQATTCGARCAQWASMAKESDRIMGQLAAQENARARRQAETNALQAYGNAHPDHG